ncbi:MAG: pilin, partial [bacterium]
MKRRTIFFSAVFAFVLLVATLLLGMLFPDTQRAWAAEATQPEIVVEVGIPGVTFSCSPKFPGKQCVHDFAEYIGGFYKFFAGVIGIIAALMVMWGGVKWLTASGNSSKVQDAKDTIYSAIIALVLTFGSYALLFTINPQIVKLELPTINSVLKITQGHGNCLENPIDRIDFSNCTGDPKRPPGGGIECCGKTLSVDEGNGHTVPCLWNACNGLDQVCTILPTGPYCAPARDFCPSSYPDESSFVPTSGKQV